MKQDNYINDNKKYKNYNQNKINYNYKNFDPLNKMNIPSNDIYTYNYYMNNNQKMFYMPMNTNPYIFPFMTQNFGINHINNNFFNMNKIGRASCRERV